MNQKRPTVIRCTRCCFADSTTMHTSGNSSIDTSLICDICCGPKVLFETCVTMRCVDDDDDDDTQKLEHQILTCQRLDSVQGTQSQFATNCSKHKAKTHYATTNN